MFSINKNISSTLTRIIFTQPRCIFSFLFIGRELTTWPASNCLQISVFLQIIFCSCVIKTMLLSKMADRFPELAWSDLTYLVDQENRDRMIKQLLNLRSVISKYRDLSVSRRSIICLGLGKMIDLLATDKSRYFAQPRTSRTINLTFC